LLCLFNACNNSTSSNNGGSYYVDWTVDGTHYRQTAVYNVCGIYVKAATSATINGTIVNPDSSKMKLSGLIDGITTTGSISNINISIKPWVALQWVPDSLNDYQSTDSTGANLSITVTSLSGPVTGSFTGKLSEPVFSGKKITGFKYVNVQGTFSIPVY
jgi:hypothetical protein